MLSEPQLEKALLASICWRHFSSVKAQEPNTQLPVARVTLTSITFRPGNLLQESQQKILTLHCLITEGMGHHHTLKANQ